MLPQSFDQSDEDGAVPVLVNEELQLASHALELQRGHLLLPQVVLYPGGCVCRFGQFEEVRLHPVCRQQIGQSKRPAHRLFHTFLNAVTGVFVLFLVLRVELPLRIQLSLIVDSDAVPQVQFRLTMLQHDVLVRGHHGSEVILLLVAELVRRVQLLLLPAELQLVLVWVEFNDRFVPSSGAIIAVLAAIFVF